MVAINVSSSLSDENLVVLIRQGNINLFAEIIGRYEKKLFNFVSRYISDPHDISDVVQEAFIAAYKNLGKYDERKKFSTWLYVISKNLAIDFLRKSGRKVPIYENLVGEDEIPFEQIITQGEEAKVRHEVNKLNLNQRKVIWGYYFENMSYKQLSRTMAVPLNTVKSYARRAKLLLRKALKEYEDR